MTCQSQIYRKLNPYLLLGSLIVGYIGIYLYRKNMSVAVPIIQKDWELSKESVGFIASFSTIAYAAQTNVNGSAIGQQCNIKRRIRSNQDTIIRTAVFNYLRFKFYSDVYARDIKFLDSRFCKNERLHDN